MKTKAGTKVWIEAEVECELENGNARVKVRGASGTQRYTVTIEKPVDELFTPVGQR